MTDKKDSLGKDALEYHIQGGRPGKIEVTATKPLVTQRHLSLAYSPGVAVPCLEIEKDPSLVFKYTAKGNLVAVISNGTAVLGLGNIGALAGKPVMEGKGCLFKKFADIDVFDIEIDETDVDKVVEIVRALEPTFGGINLEDISAPACFEIETRLKEMLKIPVFHDDQHGTAIICGAGLLNACEITGRKLEEVKIVVSGAGASAISCANFAITLGAKRENVTLVDSKGVIYEGRDRLNKYKEMFAGPDRGLRTLADAMKGADVFLGLSVKGLVSKEMAQSMTERPIIFAMANPDPEITYPDAMEACPGAIVATGRSDFPNQVNNVLGFPFIFRGALDAQATSINEEMKVAAAHALADLAHEAVPDSVVQAYGGVSFKFGPDYIIPKPFDPRVLWWEAPAVAKAAMDTGVAGTSFDIEEYKEKLARRIGSAAHPVLRGMMRTAKREPQRIVFPEANNPKLLRALQIIVDERVCKPILLGRTSELEKACKEGDHDFLDSDDVEIIDPRTSPLFDKYVDRLYAMRQRKGVTLETARSLVARSNYFGMMMLESGEADAVVSGLKLNYPETLRPALQILGLRSGVKVATGMYMMVMRDRQVKFFADASINIDPDAETLADIAVQVADAVKTMGVDPRVAMVSFSNFGSVDHPEVKKVQKALEIVRAARPDLAIDGEMQADVALDKDAMDGFPFCKLDDDANVLVFPSLVGANAAYKVLSVLGGAQPIGPIILGLAKPVMVLQKHASVEDVVNMTGYIAAIAQQQGDK